MGVFNLKDPNTTIQGEDVLNITTETFEDHTVNPVVLNRRAMWKREKEKARKKRLATKFARRRNR